MKALVTGGAGFIGSHIVDALLAKGLEVVVLDDFSTGMERNLPTIGGKLKLVNGCVSDEAAIAEVLPDVKWVFHLGAIASVPVSVENPLLTDRVNLQGTLKLLEAARTEGVQRVVFSSSAATYGNSPAPQQREDFRPDPLTPYAVQKLGGELYARSFHHLYGLETVSLRYFNVFGPRQRPDSAYSGVISRFCDAYADQKRPTVFGDGRQTRDFIYVADVVRANLRAAEAPGAKVAGQVFNIATGRGTSLLDMLDALGHITHSRLEPEFREARAGDIRHSVADVSKARELLGFQAEVSFAEGLARTYQWSEEARIN